MQQSAIDSCHVASTVNEETKTLMADDVFDFGKRRQPERQQLGHTLSALWVSGCCTALIRLWFTSALCDHQSIQLSLTAVAWSGNTKELHLYISHGRVSSNLFPKLLLICLHLRVGNGMNHSPPPLFSVEFVSPQHYSLRSPLLSSFCFCDFAKERRETKVNKKKRQFSWSLQSSSLFDNERVETNRSHLRFFYLLVLLLAHKVFSLCACVCVYDENIFCGWLHFLFFFKYSDFCLYFVCHRMKRTSSWRQMSGYVRWATAE